MPWPSTLTSFTDPLPSDRLNSPSHSSIETAQNTGLEEVQNYLGVLTGVNASAIGTLIGHVMAPASDGGGHIQTASKGGTGHTTYTKGDLIVAQSASVLVKQAVGADGQILSSNSSTASGLQWIDNSRPKVSTSASVITVLGTTNETSVLTTTIAGSALGTSNALRATVFVSSWNPRSSVLFTGRYGGGSSSILLTIPSLQTGIVGKMQYTVIADNSSSNQRTFFEADFRSQQSAAGVVSSVYYSMNVVPTSVNGSAPQTLGITIIESTSGDGFVMAGNIVEKIS